tara:strand:- start:1909 stop:2295 length:387 start_codon:yes stop_codon:yes gene_type:complete
MSTSIISSESNAASVNLYTEPGKARDSESEQTFSDLVTGVEAHAMYPGWVGEYLPKVNVLNNPDSTQVGYFAWESSFRWEHKQELEEDGGKLKQIYAEASTENEFKQAIDNDPRMLDLMEILEIRRSR